MKVNGELVTLAREYRGLSQEELAVAIGLNQPHVARIEAGLRPEVDDTVARRMSVALQFPPEFFGQEEVLLGFGSSAYYYRKKATIPATDRKRVHSRVNLLRIALKQVLPHVELQPSQRLPQWAIEDYGYSAANVARALRAHWHLPDGPIRNLTALIEAAGVIVVPCDFGASIDATSLRLADMPPLVFMNTNVPGDRWRFTLAHELAHLILHSEPHDQMEKEADEFAGELLVPAGEIKPQLARFPRPQVRDFIALKRYWKVSIQALIFRAFEAGVINEAQKKSLFVRMSQLNIRMTEPEPVECEQPTNFVRMLSMLKDAMGFSAEEIARLLRWNLADLHQLMPLKPEPVRRLRAV